MSEIQLTLAAVLGGDLDMLLVTAVIEADFVVRRRPQDVTFVIANSDMVTVR
ncbi:hypothetical protein D3C85_1176910 [compost metagenome]